MDRSVNIGSMQSFLTARFETYVVFDTTEDLAMINGSEISLGILSNSGLEVRRYSEWSLKEACSVGGRHLDQCRHAERSAP
jgi:hypothetical protein